MELPPSALSQCLGDTDCRHFRNVNPGDGELNRVSGARLRRSFRLDIGLSKVLRVFHSARQLQRLVARIASHHHFQPQLVFVIQFRMNRNQMHSRRHHLFQIFQNIGPGKRLALDQSIQKLRLIAGSAILRLVQKSLGPLAREIALRNLRLQIGNRGVVAPRMKPARNGDGHQRQG